MVREVGAYFQQHDPWRHPLSAGPARGVDFHFDHDSWATYVHLEDDFDLSAKAYSKYHSSAKPVFLGEDRYELDHHASYDPRDMRCFQRRLFWTWLLSGGSANYGGRWWTLQPYAQTGSRSEPSFHHPEHTYTTPLTGLDSVTVIREFFESRRIELSDFQPNHALATDSAVTESARGPKLMRRGHDEFLIFLRMPLRIVEKPASTLNAPPAFVWICGMRPANSLSSGSAQSTAKPKTLVRSKGAGGWNSSRPGSVTMLCYD